MFGLEDSRRYYVCQRYVRMNLGIWTTARPWSLCLQRTSSSVSIAIYPSPDATRSSSDRIRVQSVEPCSIRWHARADCKASASSSTYRTSSTRLRHCHLTLLLRNTETCYPINGNWPTNQARCYCGYAYDKILQTKLRVTQTPPRPSDTPPLQGRGAPCGLFDGGVADLLK